MIDDLSIRVEVVNIKTGKKKNIYYRYHDCEVNMKWLNDYIVEINGVQLNILKDYYHEG